ncbi:MAG: pitrilysin family protein [Acidobacteriota bacterium]
MSARFVLLFLLAVSLLLGGCQAGGPADGDGDGAMPELDNAVLMPVDGDATISFTVYFKVGSQNDPQGKEGLAALTGSIISQGATTENAYADILDKLYPIASGYGVNVDKEMTTLTGRTHRDNLDAFFEIFTDAFLKPAFDPADFERLKAVQKSGIETSLRFSNDEELGKAALTSFVFGGTPYEHPIEGTVSGIDAITLDDVKAFYTAHYNRANAVIGLGGGFDADLATRFHATLGSLPEGQAVAPAAVEAPTIEGRRVLLVDKPGADASISFGLPVGVARGERDFYALWIANSWLGEHRNTAAHLFQVIREIRGLNYGDYSYIEAFPAGGSRQMPPTNVARRHQLFEGWIRTLPNEQSIFALRAALREIDDLIEGGMSEEEFQLTRSFLETYHLHFAPTTADRLGYRVDDVFYGVPDPGHLARFGDMMKSITREDVNAALKKYLQTGDLKIAIVTGDAEGLKTTLESGAPTPITYASPKSDEVLAEDKLIAAYPLNIANIETVSVQDIFGQ